MARRVLILSFHAPPETAVGGLRWWGFARHLARRGWEVRLITASPDADKEPVPAGMQVRAVERRTTLQDRYRRWRIRSRKSGEARADPGHSEPSPPKALRSSLAALLSFPDEGRGWIWRAASTLRQTVREWEPDVVISTGPPHSIHLGAALGLVGRSTPWVVDLRDPWATPWAFHSTSGWTLPATRRLEGWVLPRARMVLTTTPELKEELDKRYPSVPVEWLPNGVDVDALPSRPPELGDGLVLTHLGNVYFNRDPTRVVRAFGKFLAANPTAAEEGAVFRFVGGISPKFMGKLMDTAREVGVAQHLDLAGVIPREKALEILAASHVALVLAQGQDVMVPAKLYESIGMGIPTLVVAEKDSAAGREAVRLGAALHEPEDVAGMADTLEQIWSGGATGWPPAPPDRVDRACLADQLETILDSV